MKIYNYNADALLGPVGLVVTNDPNVGSEQELKDAIAQERPQKGIDAAFRNWQKIVDPNHKIADAWYTEHRKVNTLDPDETPRTTVEYNDEDEPTIITLPNPYQMAVAKRTELEDAHEWLGTYRGIYDAPERTKFIGITLGEYLAQSWESRREVAYPEITVYLDAIVKQSSLDPLIVAEGVAQEVKYKSDCLQTKMDIPKPA